MRETSKVEWQVVRDEYQLLTQGYLVIIRLSRFYNEKQYWTTGIYTARQEGGRYLTEILKKQETLEDAQVNALEWIWWVCTETLSQIEGLKTSKEMEV